MQQTERWEDPQEALRSALDGRQKELWTALPGIIVSRDGNQVSVQPAIKAKQQDQKGNITDVNLPVLIHCPLVTPGGGGYAVTLPIGAGDEVLVVFASRCIDGWWQQGGVQPQMEIRMHDLSDGFAIPGYLSQANAITDISDTTAQLRSLDGVTYVDINNAGTVTVKAATVNLDGVVTINGTGTMTVNGNLLVNGNIHATGTITP
jgi:Phage protein Gp138 N-terminal domain